MSVNADTAKQPLSRPIGESPNKCRSHKRDLCVRLTEEFTPDMQERGIHIHQPIQ